MSTTPMLAARTWAVIGDVLNTTKPANRILHHLAERQRQVYPINPRLTDADIQGKAKGQQEESGIHPVSNSLSSIANAGIEVVDLCIHPALGVSLLPQLKQMGLRNIFIQPGAESQEILDYCNKNGLNVHQGCVLREMK